MTDRWQGAFATANHAGIACAIVLVAMVSMLATRTPGTRCRFPDGWLLLTFSVAAFCGLIASQSRAAVVAVFGAWLLAGCPGGRPVRIAAALGAVAACGWLLWSRGMSAIPGSHDVSTIHHLRLWADACGVAMANPLGGCGWGDFGRLWQEWLEPPAWKFGFTSALSTPLTLLAEIGFLAGIPLLALLALPACAPAGTPVLRAARATWTVALIAGLTCSFQRDPLVLGLLALAMGRWLTAWVTRHRGSSVVRSLRPIVVSSALTVLFCVAVAVTGWLSGAYGVVRTPHETVGVTLIPRRDVTGTVIAVRALGSGPLSGRTVLAAFATAGWKVLVVDQLPAPDAIRAMVDAEKLRGDVRIIVSGPAAQVVPSDLGVRTVFVDPWFGALDNPEDEASVVIRSADHDSSSGLEQAIQQAVIGSP